MITVATVLKVGDFMNGGKPVIYKPEHVYLLKKQIERHVRCSFRFVCLSNVPLECPTIPLHNDWPGWWSKIELFRPGIDLGKTIFFDIDTCIIGDITEMLTAHHDFTALRHLSIPGCIGSAMLAWSGERTEIYDAFAFNPQEKMKKYCEKSERWGDQGLIQDVIPKINHFQSMFPSQIVSYKMEVGNIDPPPRNARIVIFNGRPKPWDLKLSWIPQE